MTLIGGEPSLPCVRNNWSTAFIVTNNTSHFSDASSDLAWKSWSFFASCIFTTRNERFSCCSTFLMLCTNATDSSRLDVITTAKGPSLNMWLRWRLPQDSAIRSSSGTTKPESIVLEYSGTEKKPVSVFGPNQSINQSINGEDTLYFDNKPINESSTDFVPGGGCGAYSGLSINSTLYRWRICGHKSAWSSVRRGPQRLVTRGRTWAFSGRAPERSCVRHGSAARPEKYIRECWPCSCASSSQSCMGGRASWADMVACWMVIKRRLGMI